MKTKYRRGHWDQSKIHNLPLPRLVENPHSSDPTSQDTWRINVLTLERSLICNNWQEKFWERFDYNVSPTDALTLADFISMGASLEDILWGLDWLSMLEDEGSHLFETILVKIVQKFLPNCYFGSANLVEEENKDPPKQLFCAGDIFEAIVALKDPPIEEILSNIQYLLNTIRPLDYPLQP